MSLLEKSLIYRIARKIGALYAEFIVNVVNLIIFIIVITDRTLGKVIYNIIEGITGRKIWKKE